MIRPARNPQLGAWAMVGVCFLALAVSYSSWSSLSQIMEPLERELGWSRSTTALAASIAQLLLAMTAPVGGYLVDRFGPRLLLSAGLTAVGGGVLLASGAHAPRQFYLAFGVVSGIGFGMAATHVVATIVSLTFTERRGLAVGIATAGATAGQFIVVPILARVLQQTDWRTAYLVLGLAVIAMAALVLLLIRVPAVLRQWQSAIPEPIAGRLAYLIRSPTFHLLFWSYFICGITTTGVVEAHLIPYATFCGFTLPESSDAYGLLMAINFGGMVFSGWLADRMNRPLLLGCIYILRGLSFILLMLIARDYSYLIVFAVLFGVVDYSTVPVTASLAASHLGLRIMGLSMGLLTAGHALGAAVGAALAGILFDMFASYLWTWLVALTTAMVAGALCFAIRENRGQGRAAIAAA